MLNIDMKFNKGILIVRLNGILNKDTSHILKNKVLKIINENGIKYVLLNLYNSNYIDNYIINTIEVVNKTIKNNKGKFIVCGLNKNYIMNNLYQINEEEKAYEIVKL